MIEIDELVRLRILENNVDLLRRVMDHGHASDDLIRMIFGWQKEITGFDVYTSPAIVTAPQPAPTVDVHSAPKTITSVPPPPKPFTSKKSEMMKKVKDLRVNHSMSGKQIAEKTGMSEATVSTYLKELGLRNESSMTEISGPVPGAGK